ncbi:MAG: AraC family transcriptional regulator [Burkholderiales bacterium 70-64]|nr:MAG: AraC family transcriptional regulator [Burkholderiales bacterium 70-64]
MKCQTKSFEDVHLHAAAVRGWNQTYSQLTRGSLKSRLSELRGSRVEILWEQLNQRVVQHGEAPMGRIGIAIPIVVPGTARMQGREADGSSLYILRGGDEFMFHTPAGMEMLACTFDRELFQEAVSRTAAPEVIGSLLSHPVVKIAPRRLAECRDRILALFATFPLNAEVADCSDAEQRLERGLLHELLSLVSDSSCNSPRRPSSSCGSFMVDKCHRLTIGNASNPPSVLDLCRHLRSSRRAIQRGFRSVANTTPVNYIRSIRLNAVRRELINSRASDASIGDIAAKWGFFHLSHFASEYRTLFGELPSQTRRKR